MQKKVLMGAAGLLLAARVITYSVQTRLAEEASNQPVGKYTRNDILRMAAPLVRSVALSAPPVNLEALSTDTAVFAPTAPHLWRVDGSSPEGDHIVSLLWNGDTGTLLSVGHCSKGRSRSWPVENAADAAGVCQDWLRTLEPQSGDPHWQLVGHPERHGRSWCVSLKGVLGRRFLIISTDSGDLIRLICQNPPNHPTEGTT